MNIAVIGTSRKENEKRRPIHPSHIASIPDRLRRHLFFEQKYGEPFGMNDDEIQHLTGNKLISRSELLHDFQAILITKPVIEDFEEVQNGTLVWGWLHSVQQRLITQQAIDKKLTLIAWENMYYATDRELLHIFYRNNEMAGYCGVQHALEVAGLDGNFGPPLTAAVISFGSVSRGAIISLQAHGVQNITVYTQRPASLIANQIPGIVYKQFMRSESGAYEACHMDGTKTPMIDALCGVDMIVNGILQNPTAPIVLVCEKDIPKFTSACLVIDVSCSKAMGFCFARPTTFAEPVFDVGKIKYYGVDHTPTLLWNSATWEISKAILPCLEYVIEGTESSTVNDAVDIRNGEILNKDILIYQNRSKVYPYKQL
jgi:alanine dehydrogenase